MDTGRQRHVLCPRVVARALGCSLACPAHCLSLVPGSHGNGFPVPTAGTAALLFNNQTVQSFNRPVTVSGQLSWVSQTPPGQLLLEAITKGAVGLPGRGSVV